MSSVLSSVMVAKGLNSTLTSLSNLSSSNGLSSVFSIIPLKINGKSHKKPKKQTYGKQLLLITINLYKIIKKNITLSCEA